MRSMILSALFIEAE